MFYCFLSFPVYCLLEGGNAIKILKCQRRDRLTGHIQRVSIPVHDHLDAVGVFELFPGFDSGSQIYAADFRVSVYKRGNGIIDHFRNGHGFVPLNHHNDITIHVGGRFGNVIAVLNSMNRFQREIKITSEVRDLGDGQTAEVAVLYLGMGQAYYVAPKGDIAEIGAG